MLREIWLAPPLAFARVGPSSTPCPAFDWVPAVPSPHVPSTPTALRPAETLDVASNGTITSRTPAELVLRDAEGIRPVCPFFELHGRWGEDGAECSGPITSAVLVKLGLSLADIEWIVHVANIKAFHYTYDEGDRIDARVRISGDDTRRHQLLGVSPSDARTPLARDTAPLPMGAVHVCRADDAFPEVRLRFYAPAGHVYGPTDLKLRVEELAASDNSQASENAEWQGFQLPDEQCILNPEAQWLTYDLDRYDLGPLGPGDVRNIPGGLLSSGVYGTPTALVRRAFGLVDDVGDGVIACRVGALMARARIVVGPPDFAPANRTVVSIAENLVDREDRAGPRSGEWSQEELGALAHDILERAFETSSQMNKDYQNFRSRRTNELTQRSLSWTSVYDDDQVSALLWPGPDRAQIADGRGAALELSAQGSRVHRRNATLEYLEDRFRESPELLDRWIRRPMDPNPFFDRRMPALMRGSDGRPLHLTRRQWEILHAWVRSLRNAAASVPSPAEGGEP